MYVRIGASKYERSAAVFISDVIIFFRVPQFQQTDRTIRAAHGNPQRYFAWCFVGSLRASPGNDAQNALRKNQSRYRIKLCVDKLMTAQSNLDVKSGSVVEAR